MDIPPPPADIRELIGGVGELRRADHVVPVASFTLERAKYAHEQPWSFTAHVSQEHWTRWDDLLKAGPAPIELDGLTNSHQTIHIPRLNWRDQEAARLRADVHELLFETKALPSLPSQQYLSLDLTPTPLARSEATHLIPSSTGEIKLEPSRTLLDSPVVWHSALGDVRFVRRYMYDKVAIAGEQGLVQIPTPRFVLTVAQEHRSDRPLELMRAFVAEAEDALVVLSLLSRRPVRWHRVSLTSRCDEQDARWAQVSDWVRTVQAPAPSAVESPLVNPYRLPPAALDGLLTTFRELPHRQAIATTITYLGVVLSAPYLEVELTSAFTALEALVNGVGKGRKMDKIASAGRFRRLQDRLKSELPRFLEQAEIPAEALAAIEAKLPELNRPPIVPRVEQLVLEYGALWEDLWPAGVSLRDGLQVAFTRRNKFVHAGHLESPRQAYVDARRIHALTERLLFRMLGGDPNWHDWSSFRHTEVLPEIEAREV